MTIPVWSYLKEYEDEKAEVQEALETVFRSGRLILGESVKAFEQEFAAWCGAGFGVGVNSGTDAIFLALKALDIGPGDEVITVSNTAVPTVSAIVSTGAKPRFVDIDPATYLMDVRQLEAAVTPRTRCLLPVHLFGQCVAMEEVTRVAHEHGLKVVEDCAQSHGARRHGQRCGNLADLAPFSFYPTKILGTYGDGGMVVGRDEALAAKLRRLRFYGMEKTYYSIEHGYNSRLDELHAEILRRKMAHLDGYIARRQELARRYERALARTPLQLPSTEPGNEHAFYLYVVRHPERDRIIAELGKRDIVVNVSYPWPIHTMPAYEHLGYAVGSLPHTEKAANEIFSLPMYPTLTDAEQDTVCSALLEIVRAIG
jgi:aminotransferase EvaB